MITVFAILLGLFLCDLHFKFFPRILRRLKFWALRYGIPQEDTWDEFFQLKKLFASRGWATQLEYAFDMYLKLLNLQETLARTAPQRFSELAIRFYRVEIARMIHKVETSLIDKTFFGMGQEIRVISKEKFSEHHVPQYNVICYATSALLRPSFLPTDSTVYWRRISRVYRGRLSRGWILADINNCSTPATFVVDGTVIQLIDGTFKTFIPT